MKEEPFITVLIKNLLLHIKTIVIYFRTWYFGVKHHESERFGSNGQQWYDYFSSGVRCIWSFIVVKNKTPYQ